jgi:glycosyltransferase involved in cell wall biosynthesis
VISIVVPTYNSGAFLDVTVDSIRSQVFDNWELLLVDDGSTDETIARARAWAANDGRIRLMQQQHRGPNHARNVGLAASDRRSKSVIFLDHDDVWEKDALSTLQRALEARPEAAAAYGIAYNIDSEGAEYDSGIEAWTRARLAVTGRRIRRLTADAGTNFAVLAIGNRIPTPGQVLVRRSALECAGPWDVAAAAAADYDLWLRLSLVGDLVFVDRRVIGWRQHSGNFSRSRRIVEDSCLSVRQKYAFDPTLSEEQRNAMFVGYRHTHTGLARMRLAWAKGCFLKGDVVNGAKQLRHAALACGRSQRGLRPARMS